MRNEESPEEIVFLTPHSPFLVALRKAGNGTRTRDPNLGKVVLYQLSYSRNAAKVSVGPYVRQARSGSWLQPECMHRVPDRPREQPRQRGVAPVAHGATIGVHDLGAQAMIERCSSKPPQDLRSIRSHEACALMREMLRSRRHPAHRATVQRVITLERII